MAEKVFVFPKVDFKNGMNGGTIQYSVGNFTAWAHVTIDSEDGKLISKLALARCLDKDEIDFQIDTTSGVHDVYVKADENAEILGISFKEKSPYEEYQYIAAKPIQGDFTGADSWEAVDMLGRRIPSVEDVGAKKNKKVGIFYWTWREHAIHQEPLNLVKFFAQYPDAEYNKAHPAWGGPRGWCHWNEPLFGYYRNSDPYVIRRHAVMLAAAGVDFMVFDCTNGAFLWRDAYEPLLAELKRCLDDGINVPKVAFMLNFYAGDPSQRMLHFLYQDMYKKGKYKDLWFMHEGKPLVMAFKECLSPSSDCQTEQQLLDEMRDFFTFRPPQPSYNPKDTDYHHEDHWGWLEIFPQHKYKERPDGSCEMMTVGVAQNANKERICTCFNDKDTFGRSYTHKYGHSQLTPDSYKYGYNFQEQWDRALDISPDIVFITGWNEWIMSGATGKPWILDEHSTKIAFVDQYDYEHSRDIEPDCDGYLDTYYLQLTANIRRFKGAYPRCKNTCGKSIDIKGGFSQWKDVMPTYKNPKGLAAKRDFPGFKGCYYKNETGRNDICSAKACADNENLYFYVECVNDITKPDGEGWMTLFLKTDENFENGWNGYNFAINRKNPKLGKATVEKYSKTAQKNSFTWEEVGKCDIKLHKNKLMIKVPRTLVNACATSGGKSDFEFKWSDNMVNKDIMDFYVNGSCAPYGRFNYRFKN